MLWEGFNAMPCVDCKEDAGIINCYEEVMCCKCYSKFIEEQEDGQRIPKERSNEGFVE